MGKVQKTIEVNAPLQICFDQWMRFEEFPRFMKNVKRIVHQGEGRWHWVVTGPVGVDVEWDAVMDGKLEDRMVSWHTISDSEVNTQGAVRFDEVAPNRTKITATIQYETPAGALGEVIGKIFSNPDAMVTEELENFKNLIETSVQASPRS